MKQSYYVGLLFCAGILIGSLMSAYFVSERGTTVLGDAFETDVTVASSRDEHSALLSGAMRELQRLQGVIRTLNATALNQTKIVYVEKEPTSHEDLKYAKGPNHPANFTDFDLHKDNHDVANNLTSKIRVLCWVMTSANNLESKAIHVKQTWAKRCNKLIFVSDIDNPMFPAVGLGTDLGREHLTAKTMKAFDYIYKNHFHEADWFLKADDDTYVILENLRYMLSAHAPTEPVYFGQHFRVIVGQGYNSGGAGYVLSAEALNRFSKRDPLLCAMDQGAEDVEIGRCMEKLSVTPGDTRDRLGRSRFHCFNPATHLHGGYPQWYLQYDKYGAQQGAESMSDYPVSFHYVEPNLMYDLEYYVYHLSAYGIIHGLQDLNGDPEELARLRRAAMSTTSSSMLKTTTTAPLQPQNQQQQQQQQRKQQQQEQQKRATSVNHVIHLNQDPGRPDDNPS